jgi:kynurenine formamidase
VSEGSRRPGLGEGGVRWLSERNVAALLWDFMEASEAPYLGHLLIWAQGLAVVDNCDFAACRRLVQEKREAAGLLCVSPLRVAGATGCLVNPLLVG